MGLEDEPMKLPPVSENDYPNRCVYHKKESGF